MLNRIRIILVNTTHPGNIGGVARAMKNMAMSQLYLVEPKKFPHQDALFRASNAIDILDNAVCCDDIQQAIQGCSLVLGTSSRSRRIPWPLLNPRETAAQAFSELQQEGSGDVAILFGREDRGLTNEELQLCNYHLTIPANEDYPVLNLAMAVQVVCYEMHMFAMGDQAQCAGMVEQEWDQPWVDASEVDKLVKHAEQVLADIGFYDPETPKQLIARLRRMLSRVRLDKLEMNMLRGILATVEKLEVSLEAALDATKDSES